MLQRQRDRGRRVQATLRLPRHRLRPVPHQHNRLLHVHQLVVWFLLRWRRCRLRLHSLRQLRRLPRSRFSIWRRCHRRRRHPSRQSQLISHHRLHSCRRLSSRRRQRRLQLRKAVGKNIISTWTTCQRLRRRSQCSASPTSVRHLTTAGALRTSASNAKSSCTRTLFGCRKRANTCARGPALSRTT